MHPWSAFVADNKRSCGTILLDKRLERTQVCVIDAVYSFLVRLSRSSLHNSNLGNTKFIR